ncbi:hypothetical protein ACFSC4_00080 [Deinococcus malanensis]|uniref:hypothetical protein n=1 Tax=Deinococcus malanensis TaxID=1706855 RepID=UPI00362F5BB1
MATRVNRAGLTELCRRLTGVALAGAEGGAEVLRDKLSGEGSGRKYPGLPNRSSSQGYPAEQTGDLLGSIDARAAGPGQALFGPISDPPEYLPALLGKPPDMGGRPLLDDARHDRDVHKGIVEGVEAEAQRMFGRVTLRRRT